MSVDIDHLRQWIGRSEELVDRIGPAPMVGLSATLDRDDPEPGPGDPLPPIWHWLYHLPRARQSELGPDGHARRGGFLPPVPLPRRMWAGGRLEFPGTLRVGETVRKVSTIRDVSAKQGRGGDLVFVVVRHELFNGDGLAVTEEHDIVYRDPPAAGAAPPPPAAPPQGALWRRTISPDPVLLFRYSALTFNGHRIHYDRGYCRDEEGYPGLVFHGPLTATLLLDLVRREAPGRRVARFSFRAMAPLFDIAPFALRGLPSDDGGTVDLWAETPDGGLAMRAEAGFAP